jgi:hypothetical protein
MIILYALLWAIGWYLTSWIIYNIDNIYDFCDDSFPMIFLSIFVWPVFLMAIIIVAGFISLINPIKKSFDYLNKKFKALAKWMK